MTKRLKWTESEDKQLSAAYPHTSTEEISRILERTPASVYNRAKFLGLKKNPEYISSLLHTLSAKLQEEGKAHRFPKGHIPANKGTKMPEQVYAKAERTMFRKGHVPANHKPVGYERLTRDGYIEIKVTEPNKFILKHRMIWEQTNGPIPKGYNVQFKNGNREEITPDNLYLISRAEQMKHENSYHARYPEEVRKSIQLMGALQRQINKRKKS